jgi:hypothetical protein
MGEHLDRDGLSDRRKISAHTRHRQDVLDLDAGLLGCPPLADEKDPSAAGRDLCAASTFSLVDRIRRLDCETRGNPGQRHGFKCLILTTRCRMRRARTPPTIVCGSILLLVTQGPGRDDASLPQIRHPGKKREPPIQQPSPIRIGDGTCSDA